MKKKTSSLSVRECFSRAQERLYAAGKYATCRNYLKTNRSFQAFLQKEHLPEDLPLDGLTPELMARYNRYLDDRCCVRNTISFYNRILRALYNRASADGWVGAAGQNPFREVYTGVDKTRKRFLDRSTLQRIHSLELQAEPELALSRDLFLFSLYARGMCYVDIAYLKHSDIRGDMLCYVRSKTGQRLNVRMESCMKEIVARYKGSSYGDYVFPLIRSNDPAQAFRDYDYHLCRHNLLLKEIGRRAHTSFPLCSYAARHSWATLARDAKVPVSVISAGMGHTSEKTTRIYLADLNHAVVDRANRHVINFMLLQDTPRRP